MFSQSSLELEALSKNFDYIELLPRHAILQNKNFKAILLQLNRKYMYTSFWRSSFCQYG